MCKHNLEEIASVTNAVAVINKTKKRNKKENKAWSIGKPWLEQAS